MAKPKAPAAPRQDVPPPPAAPLDRTEVEHGLRYVHLVGEGLRREVRNGNTSLYALLDVLIAKGVVSYREMDEARAATEPGHGGVEHVGAADDGLDGIGVGELQVVMGVDAHLFAGRFGVAQVLVQ